MNRVIQAATVNLGIDGLEVSEHRGRFGGVEIIDATRDFSVRYDRPHTLKYGRTISPEKTKLDHGPGGELHHLDVHSEHLSLNLRYFEAPDGHIYQYDMKSGSLYQKVGESADAEWRLVSTDIDYSRNHHSQHSSSRRR